MAKTPDNHGPIQTTPSGKRLWDFNPINDDRIVYPNAKLDVKVNRYTIDNGFSTPGNTPATSQWSTPRGCPLCGGHLTLFDYLQQFQLVVVQCHTCWHTFHEPDLLNDEVYRLIPEDMRLASLNKVDRARQILKPGG
jgi:hypothetical protein